VGSKAYRLNKISQARRPGGPALA
jgi:preprotein translocase subunit SecE